MKSPFLLVLALVLISTPVMAQPNVVIFLVDDLGWQDTSVAFHSEVTPLNRRYRTPNMERLAARGMKFTNAYASAPVCTPTRTSIMTGMSPARSHITYWTLRKDTDQSKYREDIAAPAWNMNGLTSDDVTLPKLLRDAGYRTIHAGKAHLGAHDTSGADPRNLGFDVNIAGHASGGPASFYGTHHFTVAGRNGKDPTVEPRTVWDIPGLDAYHGRDIYLTEALTIESVKAVRDAVADERPFFLHFAPYAVHAPIMANQPLLPHYSELDAKEAAYATMIESVDMALGRLMHLFDELDVSEETIIIFTSDNGGLSAHARGAAPDGETKHTHNAPLRSGKGSAYEGGTRVAQIVSWPHVTEPASVCDVPVISHDLFYTVLSMAGLSPPVAHLRHVDGRDITPLCFGDEEAFDSSRVIGWHQPHQWGASGPGIWPFTSIRHGDWKLIYFHAGRRFELYNLAEDLGEANDLAASEPDRVREMAQMMSAWIHRNGAQMSIDRATGLEIERPDVAAAESRERP